MLPLKGCELAERAALAAGQVDRRGADRLDVGARGVEVGVVRHAVARPEHRRREDALRGAPLVGRDHVVGSR